MRRRAALLVCTIAIITISALFFINVHVYASTTTVTVTPESGEQTQLFDASATTDLGEDPGDWCIFRWFDPSDNKFYTGYDFATPFTDSWKSGVDDPIGTYEVKAIIYDGDTGQPKEAEGSDTFDLSEWPVFPSGLIFPILALCISFIILNKKLMKPKDDSIFNF